MRLIDADALKKDDELTEWITRDAIRTGKMLKAFSELFVKKIDDAPTVNAVSEEVYTREYNLRKDAEFKVYKLEKALEQEACDKCVYSTKDGYCQYDDITEAISPLEHILDKIKADIEEQIKRDFSFAENEEVKASIHYGTANGLQVAIKIIDKYRGEVDCRECKAEYECYYCKKYGESEVKENG